MELATDKGKHTHNNSMDGNGDNRQITTAFKSPLSVQGSCDLTPLLLATRLSYDSTKVSNYYLDRNSSSSSQSYESSQLPNVIPSAPREHPCAPAVVTKISMSVSAAGHAFLEKMFPSRNKQPLEEKEKGLGESKCSNLQAAMLLFRGNTGPGILSLPAAFKFGGLWAGLGCFLLIATVAIRSLHSLLRCATYLNCSHQVSTTTYADVTENMFYYGHQRLKKYSTVARHFTNGLMQAMQYGTCCVYFIFIATTTRKVVSNFSSNGPDMRLYEFCVYLLVIPYIMIRDLKILSFFSTFANILYLSGLVLICQEILQDLPDVSHRDVVGELRTWPLFFGSSLFAFEGVNVVIPVRNKMKTPEDLDGWNGLLNVCMVTLTSIYTTFGFYGYLKYGEDTEGSVTLNLPEGQWLGITVNSMLALMVFFSIAVQFYIPINVISPPVLTKMGTMFDMESSEKKTVLSKETMANCLIRFVLISFIFLIALVVPHVELMISLVGALLGTVMTIILPSILDLLWLQSAGDFTFTNIALNVVIIVFGVVGLVSGTYTSLRDIVAAT